MRFFLIIFFLMSISNQSFSVIPEDDIRESNYVAVHIWPSAGGEFGHAALTIVEDHRPIVHLDLYPDRQAPVASGSSGGATGYYAPDFRDFDAYADEAVRRNPPKTIRLYSLDRDKIWDFFDQNRRRIFYHFKDAWDLQEANEIFKKTLRYLENEETIKKDLSEEIRKLCEKEPLKAAAGAAAWIATEGTLQTAATYAASSIPAASAGLQSLAVSFGLGAKATLAVAAAPFTAVGLGSAHAVHSIANGYRRNQSYSRDMRSEEPIYLNCCSFVDMLLVDGGKNEILDQFSFGRARHALRSATVHAFGPPESRVIRRPGSSLFDTYSVAAKNKFFLSIMKIPLERVKIKIDDGRVEYTVFSESDSLPTDMTGHFFIGQIIKEKNLQHGVVDSFHATFHNGNILEYQGDERTLEQMIPFLPWIFEKIAGRGHIQPGKVQVQTYKRVGSFCKSTLLASFYGGGTIASKVSYYASHALETTIGVSKNVACATGRSFLSGVALSPDELLKHLEVLSLYERSLFRNTIREDWISNDYEGDSRGVERNYFSELRYKAINGL